MKVTSVLQGSHHDRGLTSEAIPAVIEKLGQVSTLAVLHSHPGGSEG